MASKSKYLVFSDKEITADSWEAAMQSCFGICHTLSKAYEIALFLSGITQPKIKYRKALETIKAKGVVKIESEKEEPSCLIIKVKIY